MNSSFLTLLLLLSPLIESDPRFNSMYLIKNFTEPTDPVESISSEFGIIAAGSGSIVYVYDYFSFDLLQTLSDSSGKVAAVDLSGEKLLAVDAGRALIYNKGHNSNY